MTAYTHAPEHQVSHLTADSLDELHRFAIASVCVAAGSRGAITISRETPAPWRSNAAPSSWMRNRFSIRRRD